MTMPVAPEPMPVQIESVQFEHDRIVVSYMEASKQSARVQQITTLVIDPDAVEDELREVYEAVIALIDAGLLAWRNPPDSILSRNAPKQ